MALLSSIIRSVGVYADFYVANSGLDSFDGTGVTKPWQTLDKLETEIALGNLDGKIVGLRAGDLWNEKIDFAEHDNVTIISYGDGVIPKISGLKTLDGAWISEGSNVWSFDLSALSPGNIRYLLSNSSEMQMCQSAINTADVSPQPTTSIFYTSTLGGSDDDYNDAEVLCRTTPYTWEIRNVLDYVALTGKIELTAALSYYFGESSYTENKYFFQNSLKVLNNNATNNEWCYDSVTKKLYYYHDTTNPGSLAGIIQISLFDKLIDIENTNNTTIKDVKFEYANHYGVFGGNSNYKNINNCEIDHCIFGIWEYHTTSTDSIINNNLFSNMGSTALQQWYPVDITCTNNTLIDSGVEIGKMPYIGTGGDYWGYNGIDMRIIGGLVEYNNIIRCGYIGLKMSESDGNGIVRNNYVEDPCRLLVDGGGYYCWDLNELITSNRIQFNNNIAVITDYTNNDWLIGLPGGSGGWAVHGFYKDGYMQGVNYNGNFAYGFKYGAYAGTTKNSSWIDNKFISPREYNINSNVWAFGLGNIAGKTSENNTVTGNLFIAAYGEQPYRDRAIFTHIDNLVLAANNIFDYNKIHQPIKWENGYEGVVVYVDYKTYITASTIAFNDNDPDADTITDSANGFITAGILDGGYIMVLDSTNNNGTYKIDTVTAGVITLASDETLIDELAGSSRRIISVQEQDLDIWKSNANVGKHETSNTLTFDISGLSDWEEFIWVATNPTKVSVSVSFPSGYRYYTVDGNEITFDTLASYKGEIYFRTIDEGMPQITTPTFTGTCQVGQTQTSVVPSTIFTHEEGNAESGSTYQWYISEDNTKTGRVAVSGATSSTWAIPAGQGSKYAILGVIPKAAIGTGTLLTGVERFSEPKLIAA